MQLLLIIIIAGLVGYFLSRSRFSKNIDETAGKVSDTSREWFGKAEDGVSGLFGRKKDASEEVVDAEFSEEESPAEETPAEETPDDEEKKPAEKAVSRRKAAEK